MESVLPPVGKNAPDIIRHILQIPFVNEAVDLPRFFISFVGGVRVIHNTDETNPPDGEQAMDIFFDKFQFTGEAGLRFAQDDIKPAILRILQQSIKLRALSVGAGVIVVAVNVINVPSLFHGVLQQHGLLVLNAVAVVGFQRFISVLFGQTAVNSGFHHSDSPIPRIIMKSPAVIIRPAGCTFPVFELIHQLDPFCCELLYGRCVPAAFENTFACLTHGINRNAFFLFAMAAPLQDNVCSAACSIESKRNRKTVPGGYMERYPALYGGCRRSNRKGKIKSIRRKNKNDSK